MDDSHTHPAPEGPSVDPTDARRSVGRRRSATLIAAGMLLILIGGAGGLAAGASLGSSPPRNVPGDPGSGPPKVAAWGSTATAGPDHAAIGAPAATTCCGAATQTLTPLFVRTTSSGITIRAYLESAPTGGPPTPCPATADCAPLPCLAAGDCPPNPPPGPTPSPVPERCLPPTASQNTAGAGQPQCVISTPVLPGQCRPVGPCHLPVNCPKGVMCMQPATGGTGSLAATGVTSTPVAPVCTTQTVLLELSSAAAVATVTVQVSTPVSSTSITPTPLGSPGAGPTPVSTTPVAPTPVSTTPVATQVSTTTISTTPVSTTTVPTVVSTTTVTSTPVTTTPVSSTDVGSVTVIGTGTFGAAEGASDGWVLVAADPSVATVRLSDGAASDQSGLSGGLAVLALPATTLAGATVEALDGTGTVTGTAAVPGSANGLVQMTTCTEVPPAPSVTPQGGPPVSVPPVPVDVPPVRSATSSASTVTGHPSAGSGAASGVTAPSGG